MRSLAPPLLLARAAAEQQVAQASDELLEQLAAEGREGWRQVALREAREALALVTAGGTVDVRTAARLSVSLHDVAVRDEVATWALTESDAMLALASQVVRSVPPPDDAPACTLLAWVAYERGDGASVNVALDRALGSDPSYRLAGMLRAALDGGLPPSEIRRTMRGGKRRARS